jgi:anti-sigma factor RsiW
MTGDQSPLSHRELQELLGAYALDALEPETAALVADHLRECATCAEEVAGHHEVAGLLANSGGAAPAELWENIARRLNESQPPPWDQLARRLDREAELSSKTGVAESGEIERNGGAARAPSDTNEALRSRRAIRWALGLAAAAIVVVAIVLGVQLGNLHHQLAESRASSLAQAERAALGAPTTHQIQLTSPPSGQGQPTSEVTVVVTASGTGFVVTHELPPLSAGKIYQLWAVTGEQKISLGLLGSQPGIAAFAVAGNRSVDAFAITAERAGGVVQPTSPPVVQGAVPR